MSLTFGLILLFASFFLLVFLRIPIAFALGYSSIITALALGIPLASVFQKMVTGLDSFTFLAVPFFIFGAQVMTVGGISKRLMAFANVLVGRIRGGSAMVNIVTSMFFGGISGSSVADVSSIGSFLIPAMNEDGYDNDYSIAVTVTSSVQGVIIPPSQNMIYFSMAAGGLSIAKLFLAGYIPGILLGVALMVVAYIIALKRNYPKGRGYTLSEAFRITRDALLGLFSVVIIIGGVVAGIFTATESAAVAAVYSLFITVFVYKEMTMKKFIMVLKDSIRTLAMIIVIIATSSAFGYLLAYLQVPLLVANFFTQISENPIVILLLINVLLLILGMFMDMGILILLLTPILLPVVTSIGMSPIHFGIMMMLNLGLGLCTPPVGTSLFVGCAIGKSSIEQVLKGFLPFYGVMLALLLVITYIPAISMWLPSLLQ